MMVGRRDDDEGESPIGRPRRPAVEDLRRWPAVRDLVLAGVLTRGEAARRLKVRMGTFVRLSSGSEMGVPISRAQLNSPAKHEQPFPKVPCGRAV